jgi:glycosyltransferase involved in cell wall biosynthesis
MSDAQTGRMRIAVALTTCDSEAFLDEQLDSIARQTRLPDAMVVGDDRSTDRTPDLLAAFAARVPFPVVVLRHESRIGPIRNTQAVLERCADAGDVIAIADHDDVWAAEKLAVIEDVFGLPATPVVWFSDARLVDAAGEPLPGTLFDMVHLGEGDRDLIRSGGGLRRLVHGETVTNPTMAIDAQLASLCLPFPVDLIAGRPAFQQDGWMAVIGRVRGAIGIDDRPLIAYRRHDRSVSHGEALRSVADDSGSRRRAELSREQGRARLVADRVRHRDAPWDPDQREEILALDRFLTARMERGLFPRMRAIARELRAGSYRRFAQGVRTAAYDLASTYRA